MYPKKIIHSAVFVKLGARFFVATFLTFFFTGINVILSVSAKDNLIVIDNGNEFHHQTTLGTPCGVDQFACRDLLKCIPKSSVCDFSVDCYDSSDEPNDCSQVTCRPGMFQCKHSRKCIPSGWICDGQPDCGFASGHLLDLSDEDKCKLGNPCQKNYMKCQDGITCKPISEFCDGYPDCPDFSDEHEFCGNTTLCNDATHCTYGCKPGEKGPICYCPLGKEFTGTECADSNECLIEGACDQKCHSNGTSKVCECVKDYELIDGVHCIALNVPIESPAYLLHQDSREIRWIHLNGSLVANTSSYESEPHVALLGLTFEHHNETVCWINHSNISSTLRCASSTDLSIYWDNPNPYLYSLEDVYEIAYDWISWNFYFVDDGKELIFMCSANLSSCIAIVDVDVSKPRGLALDPTEGYMFFTVWGRSGAKLERTSMDGSNRTNLVKTKIVYPFGITVDFPLRHVYWVDKYLDSIERIDYDGGNRRTIYSEMQQLHDVTIFENNLFVITWQENSINKLNKFEPTNYTTLAKNLTKPFSLQVFHLARQPGGHLYCLELNCPHLCFRTKEKPYARCACPEGFVLQNGRSCIRRAYSKFLIYAKARPGSGIKSFSLKTNDSNVMVPIVDKYFYSAFDYDSTKSTIYYFDSNNFRLVKKSLSNVTSEVYLEKGIAQSEGIAIDWMGRNIYWTDENLKVIYVANLDDSKQKKLLISADFPKSIVLDPERGYMYWSNWARGTEKDGWVEQAWMNGEERKKIVSNLIWPLGLTIDMKDRLLYWSDSYQYTIERISLDNTNSRQLIYKANPTETGRPLGMSFFKDTLYLTLQSKILKVKVPRSSDIPKVEETQFETILSEEAAQIKVYDASLQEGTNKCSGDHGCPEICVAIPESPGSECLCSDGFEMSDDAKICKQISNYTHPLACNASQFECVKFPKCIPDKLQCDEINDCEDGSDESSSPDGLCVYEPGLCGRNNFHCGGRICIPSRFVCNGNQDCQDGSDERTSMCNNSSAECTEFEFQCQVSKRCIPKSWVCDHEKDCGPNDTSDESPECEYPECTQLQFKCKNKFCIPLETVCDAIQDCTDSSDEELCEVYCNRTSKLFCAEDSKCIEPKEICDGNCQCSSGSDELNCPGKIEPACVHRSLGHTPDIICSLEPWWDSYVDKQTCQNITCGRETWKCIDSPNTQCIPRLWRCDGQVDCGDGSDEYSCPTKVPQCPFPSRLCENGTKCIGVNQLCNNVRDCQTGSDEGALCAEKQCDATKKAHHNCSDHCHNAPEGHVCYCRNNRHLTADLSTCVDEHPCDQWGRCSQICKRVNKRHHCLCFPGYDLLEDGFTCKSLNHVIPYLVFSNRHELRGINLRTVQFNSLISNLRNSIALDFYYAENASVIFWTDVVDDRIYKGSLVSGSLINIDVVIQTGLATAEGLAVDWIGENLYWVESNLDQIEVAKLNGSFRKTLISGEMVSPRSIAVDPAVGVLFWSDWEADSPRIEKASMSGELRKVVIRVGHNNDGAWPNGLTLDYDLRRVFWVDARMDSIHTIKYDGSDFQTVLEKHESLSHPFAITIFDSELFWTDWRSNSVMRANKFDGSNVTTIHRTYTQPFDVKIIHPNRQPKNIQNPCGVNNGNCSHLCLLGYNSTSKCGCPHLMIIGPDKHTCIPYEKMLLFSRLNEIRAVYLDQPYYHAAPPISLNLIVNPANLHFVAKYKQIYFCDTQSGETKRANITAPSIKTLIDAAAGKPLAIGVDWISNLIFIALQNPLRNSISVVDLDGQFFTTIIQGKNDLRGVNSIGVNPYKGVIFFSDGSAKNQFTIQMSQMDGTNRVILSNSRTNNELDSPISLSYDFKSDRLYWVNYQAGKVQNSIQYYDFGKKDVKTIFFGDLRPTVITVHGNYVFFASEKQDSILKGDKTLGNEYIVVRNSTENIYSMRVYDPEEQIGTNPCAESKGGCEHLCLPVSSVKRVCKCAMGFKIDDKDGTRCKSIDPVLIYADSSGIKGISPQVDSTDDLLVPIPLVSFATDIDVDERKGFLYWLDHDKGRVSRLKRDGTSKEVVLTGLDSVIGLAIDWSSGIIYFASPKESVIEIAHLNGSSRYVLITNDLDKPMSIALDPISGFLFWSDIAKGRIERSLLDGTSRTVIVQKEVMRVADITLDLENLRIYWCDSADKIESCNYDGTDRRVVYFGEPDSQLHSPVVSNGQIYWIDIGHLSGSIMTASITASGNFTQTQVVRKNLGVTMKDLNIFSKGRQSKRNLCGKNNGGCNDLCLFNGTHANCICAHGKIGADGKTCEPYDAFLVFSRVQSIETVHVTGNITPNSPYKPIQSAEHIRNAIGLAFDLSRHTLFYSDVQLGTINSVFFNGTNFTVIAEKQGSVEGLYFEASHNDLYWTCSNDASINRLNPQQTTALGKRAKVQKILKLNSNDRPRGLAVDPCESRIYWTNWDNNRPSIQRSYMSGYQLESIITTEIRMPNGLTLDNQAKVIYWVDARLDKIERADFDGKNRKVIGKDKPKHAFAIAVYGNYLYWTDWVLLSVLRANKYNGDDVVVLRKDIPKPMGIVAVSNQTHTCISHPCKIQNGGCAELCNLNEFGKVKCSCHPGKAVLEGGRCGISHGTPQQCGDNFECSTGGCVPYNVTCDSVHHCPDGSDEDVSYCATRECKHGYFTCPWNRCISETSVCNGHSDCSDSSDERNCNCTTTQYACGDGRCINSSLKCDNHPDCRDAFDEIGCPHRVCPPSPIDSEISFFQCEKTTACIHRTWLCDGQNDCWDNSDEANCTTIHGLDEDSRKKSECQPNSFFCKDGQCILPSWRCDNDRDCESGEDEMNCQYTCRPGQFNCKSGECISSTWFCDGTPDCVDSFSDEIPECGNRTCEANQFKCNTTGRCIPNEWKCDGDDDCGDFSDENECANLTRVPFLGFCSPNQFQCPDGLCIIKEYFCDRDDDCGDRDHSDEPLSCHYNKCDNTTSFMCGNGHCVPRNVTCNGIFDCYEDHSDEDNKLCGRENYCSGVNEFLCKNNACINESLLCNGEDDCGTFEDELGCNINECEQAGTCQHICVDRKVGYKCECHPGYRVNPFDSQLCVDIDECTQRPCSQVCRNSQGSYSCSCKNGYILKNDLHSCKSNSSEHVRLMFSNQYYIRLVNLELQEVLIAQNLSNAVALDYDWAESCIYWSDVTAFGSSIKRLCNIFSNETNSEQTLHHITVQSPDGLAVDWIGKNLYWCDKGTDTIEVSKLNGTYRKVLISEGLQEPRAIALDPFHGFLYWTDWGETPHIGKAGMDGSNVKQIVQDNLGWPNALTISYETNEIFWADAREDYIGVANLNGQNIKIVHSRVGNPSAKVHHIFAISVFEDWIYWSDWETKSVEKCHKYTGLNQSTVTRTIHRPMDVKVFHPDRQPPVLVNPCENNGGCPTLCLLTPGGGHVCQCPENFILTADGKSCKHNCTSSQFVCENTFKCIPIWWRCDKQNDCGEGDSSDEPSECPEFKCTPGQYQCAGGEDCIHPAQLCDGRVDCKNGTDEENCDKHTCFSTQFKCGGNGSIQSICIPSYKRCDAIPDCHFMEDEIDCLPQTCPKNQFKCDNGKCLQLEWVCDEENDCGDFSDEVKNCTQRACEDTKFRCRSGKCIPIHWKCDGERDCSQGEDEPEECSKQEAQQCDPTYFRCANNKCVPGRWKCDYDNDCEDNSDEIDCKPRNCSESEIRCGDGRCIRGSYRCNGEYNCEDHSDEFGCNSTCSSQEFTCTNPQFCIANSWKCDGDLDCLDGTDEICSKQVCHPDQFMCSNGECISQIAWRCDGERDCSDSSDEDVLLCAKHTCLPGRFRCRNNICIPYSKACDRTLDCADGSDEIDAMCIGKLGCPTGEFQCANKGCINSSLVCDGYNDCIDSSDEKDCASCPFAACSHVCLLKKPTHTLSRHNFSCECAFGYSLTLVGNSTYCAAKGEPAFMLVASENELKSTNPLKPYGNETTRYFTPGQNSNNAKIESMDYLLEADGGVRIFWTSITLKTIQSIYQPNKNVTRSKRGLEEVVNIITGLDVPFGIAVDWIAKRIYFVDAGQDTVSVSSLDGNNRMVLINKDLSEPHDITLDPDSGVMFWSDWISQRIDVAKMDGTDRRTLATSPCPSGLTVDYPAKRLYWTDVKSHSVESSTLDGKDRRVIKRLAGGEFKPYRIDVFEDTLYLTTYQSNRILKMNKFGKGNVTDISQGLQKASDIVIIQTYKQRAGSNPCDKMNCVPPGICLLNGPNSTTCVCPNGRAPVKVGTSKFECNSTTGAVCDLNCKQGKCRIGVNGPSCHCHPMYEGFRCEKYRCSGYCKNKGLCYQDLIATVQNDAPLKCNCPPDWTGEFCENPFLSCITKCENGGSCNEKTNTCICPQGYAGRFCEKCDGFECENGGRCVKDKRAKMTCACPLGYSGLRCETSKCMNYCLNKGKCKIKDDIPDCTCAPGFGGNQCATDYCEGLCRNGGKCLRNPNGASCSCTKPFTGVHCEINPCDCSKTKCRPEDKSCQCPPPDIAPECSNGSSKIVQCSKDFCAHGGICEVIKNIPLCRCTESWIGLHCELHSPHKNPCPSYCLHGGICVLVSANERPTCKCQSGWDGVRCQNRNSCQKYCWNGGTCILNPDSDLQPTCKCLEKFSGVRCQTREDLVVEAQDAVDEDAGITWILVLVFIVVAVAVAGFSGCAAYFVMRRKRGRPFLHVRMHDNGTVEINNPMFLKEEGDDDHAEPSLIFDSDKVLLQGTNFANPVYETMYKEGESSTVSDEKKGLLQADDCNHPLADPLA